MSMPDIDGTDAGAVIYFDIPSVTGTENLLMAAVLAEGKRLSKMPPREPEVGNLIDMLMAMGARIEGRDTDRLTIHGVKELLPADCTIIPDRIETGTYLIAIAATGGSGDGHRLQSRPSAFSSRKTACAGLQIVETDGFDQRQLAVAVGRSRRYWAASISRPCPIQAIRPISKPSSWPLMTLGSDICVITETIFENRFMHVAELQRMGAKITGRWSLRGGFRSGHERLERRSGHGHRPAGQFLSGYRRTCRLRANRDFTDLPSGTGL